MIYINQLTIRNLSNHILAVGNNHNLVVNNLKLNKTMYFCMRVVVRNHKLTSDLISSYCKNPFLVWRYGPTIKMIHDQYSFFGANMILGNYQEVNKFKWLNNYIIKLLRQNTMDLVNQSIQNPFWQDNYQKINYGSSNIAYPLSAFKNKGVNTMNYKQLEKQLQNTLPKKNSVYQCIKVNYSQGVNKNSSKFSITWGNQGENFGKIADIEGNDVTFHNFSDVDTIKIIMDFVKQSISEKLDLPKQTKITHSELNSINKLFNFFNDLDRFTKVNSQLSESDVQNIKAFTKNNKELFK